MNPLDIGPNDLDLENWVCSSGVYQDGKITCIVPKISNYNPESMMFNVDVALNG